MAAAVLLSYMYYYGQITLLSFVLLLAILLQVKNSIDYCPNCTRKCVIILQSIYQGGISLLTESTDFMIYTGDVRYAETDITKFWILRNIPP